MAKKDNVAVDDAATNDNSNVLPKPEKVTAEQGTKPLHEFSLKVGDCVIQKDGKQTVVSISNFKTVYEKAGWEKIDEMTAKDQKKNS